MWLSISALHPVPPYHLQCWNNDCTFLFQRSILTKPCEIANPFFNAYKLIPNICISPSNTLICKQTISSIGYQLCDIRTHHVWPSSTFSHKNLTLEFSCFIFLQNCTKIFTIKICIMYIHGWHLKNWNATFYMICYTHLASIRHQSSTRPMSRVVRPTSNLPHGYYSSYL